MSWRDACLCNIEAIPHVEYETSLLLDGHFSNLSHFVEVFVQVFISVQVNNILETVQELVEGAVVLQDKHVAQIGSVSFLIRKVGYPLIDFQETLLDACHVIIKISPILLPVEDPVDYCVTSSSTLLLLLPQLILSVS